MQYFEDYLELIEQLPQGMRDSFTSVREYDLSVANQIDSLEKRTEDVFKKCDAGEISPEEAEEELEIIHNDYKKPMEDSEEKVNIVSAMMQLHERYMKKLDVELAKYKVELESDSPGITAQLERRCLEQMSAASNAPSYMDRPSNLGGGHGSTPAMRKQPKQRKAERQADQYQNSMPLTEKNSLTSYSGLHSGSTLTVSANANASTSGVNNGGTIQPVLERSHFSVVGIKSEAANDIVAAASQAILATQQLTQGRRTASLKASYEAVSGSGGTADLNSGRTLAATMSSQQLLHAANTLPHYQGEKKQRKPNVALTTSAASPLMARSVAATPVDYMSPVYVNQMQNSGVGATSVDPNMSAATASNNIILAASAGVPDEWQTDPNEARYCICNQVSYGDMVACDESGCPQEWFHYSCVNISVPPKGKWYCPACQEKRARARHRKNSSLNK